MSPYTYKRRAALVSRQQQQVAAPSVESSLAFASEVLTTPVHAVMSFAFLALGAVSLCAMLAISYPEISNAEAGPITTQHSVRSAQVLGVHVEAVQGEQEVSEGLPTYAVFRSQSGTKEVVGYCTFISPGEFTVTASVPPASFSQ